MKGAEQAWHVLRLNRPLWKRVITYGLESPERQQQLNKVAFPESNAAEVDAALAAGNKLKSLVELASGRASVAKDPDGSPKVGRHGLQIVRHAHTARQQAKPSAAGGLLLEGRALPRRV